jgi:hypothetical protein
MPNRNSLHNLVDTLPEEALESIGRVLQHHQKWPPQPPIDAKKLHDQVRERFAKYAKEYSPQTGHGPFAGFSGGGHVSAEGDARASMTGWEGDTRVEVEHRVFRGHKLEIEERLRISDDKKSLLYSQSVKGPAGKTVSHEIEFDVTEDR